MREKVGTFALIGNPVEHSLSPIMHNAAFRAMGINARYIALRADTAADAVKRITEADIRGGSITIPHKVAMMGCIHHISDSAARIGAVNTFVNNDGVVHGDNTDWIGIVRSVKESETDLVGKTVAILGAGGAARAAVYGMMSEGARPVVLNRTEWNGMKLADEFGCASHPLRDIKALRADILINTTPAGMAPETDDTPVSVDALKNFAVVMDIIYNPLKTRLLREADAAGCSVINGLSMFVHQGAEQILIWTGQAAPCEIMKEAVTKELGG
jgi:shikimate dehydrogenase